MYSSRGAEKKSFLKYVDNHQYSLYERDSN